MEYKKQKNEIMIHGLGIDIVEVDRVSEKIKKEKGFREAVFSTREVNYCESKINKYEHYAARFTAKEAFLKATGKGFINGIAFNEIEVSNEASGKPYILLIGITRSTLSEFNKCSINLSISHTKETATAIVVIEKI